MALRSDTLRKIDLDIISRLMFEWGTTIVMVCGGEVE